MGKADVGYGARTSHPIWRQARLLRPGVGVWLAASGIRFRCFTGIAAISVTGRERPISDIRASGFWAGKRTFKRCQQLD
jgi:hypothetical protein